MTKHSKINPDKAQPVSLFERADAVFGLDQLGAGALPVPGDLPKPVARQRAPLPLRRQPSANQPVNPAPAAGDLSAQGSANTTETSSPKAAPSQPAVQFSGPVQAIDRGHLRNGGMIVPEAPVTALLEEFRIVKRELLADARAADNKLARRILVCSPHSGEGKTYCATNLAIALAAERDFEVVLVDADVIKPSVTHRLGIEGGSGLMDAIANPGIAPESLVISTDIPGLYVLPAGSPSTLDAEYLASERTAQVLDRLTCNAPRRFLVFDTPPALAASPAAELAGHVGQAVLVARAEETSRAALEDAQHLLSACADIKLLLNAARYSPSGRRFGKYGEQEQ